MTSTPIKQCTLCAHWAPDGSGTQTCAAFPVGIPDEIWWNRADHRKPFPGDHGVRWAPDGDVEFPELAVRS
jgi:hypothetical protein